MLAPSVQIAVSKSTSPAEREMLDRILLLAEQLDKIENSFADKINSSKASRGEPPTKLSRAKRAELQQYDEDAKEMGAQQLLDLQAFESSTEVIFALHMGLESDAKFWQQAHRHAHPADVPIVQEFAEAKLMLCESMGHFLKTHGQSGG